MNGGCPEDCPTCYPTSMNKTSVYLSSDEATRLAALAKREGTSQAEVIRRAIRNYEPVRRGDRNFALAGAATGSGSSVAALTDEELMKGFGA
jgi:hypothetical protein